MKYAINGRFLVRKLTGQERFAYEILSEFDKLIEPGEYCLVAPKYADDNIIPVFKNIQVIKYGNVKSHFWEQISFSRFLKKNKLMAINLTTTCPYNRPGITCIHDISYHVNKQWFRSLYGRMSAIWHKILAYSAFKKSPLIFTVSNFSKNQMIDVCKIDGKKIVVLGNGWDHFNKVLEDDQIFNVHKKLIKKNYILAASSITPQKNFVWVKNVAMLNPNIVFAIAGSREKLMASSDFNDIPENMIFLGYVSDGEMKSLMKNCKYFVHPALFEGFGITPMEAMSVGAKVIVSDIAIFKEIYGDAVMYLNPFNYNFDFSKFNYDVDERHINEVLNKYKWKNMAKIMFNAINERI